MSKQTLTLICLFFFRTMAIAQNNGLKLDDSMLPPMPEVRSAKDVNSEKLGNIDLFDVVFGYN